MAERKKPISPIQLKEKNSELLRENRTLQEECTQLREYTEELERRIESQWTTITEDRKNQRVQLEKIEADHNRHLEDVRTKIEALQETIEALQICHISGTLLRRKC